MLGIALLDSANNAVGFGPFINEDMLYRIHWTSTGTNINSPTTRLFACDYQSLYFLRVTDDGTTRKFYVSMNGLDFYLWYGEASNTDVTPTKAGLMIYNNSGIGSSTAIYSFYNYVVTDSILPQFS
jgi:hypothetical protein